MKDTLALDLPRDRLMTVPEVAKLLHHNRDWVYAAAQRGDIPCRRVGRRVLFAPGDVQAMLEAVKAS